MDTTNQADRLTTQRFTFQDVLSAHCGQALSPELVDKLVRVLVEASTEGNTAWAFRPVAPEADITKILLEVVPGDGSGHEVYAKTNADVENAITRLCEEIERLQDQVTRARSSLDQTVEYMNEGCICGRAPAPKHPVDPRLLKGSA